MDAFARDFGVERSERLAAFVDRVVAENKEQNLISPATVDQIWTRHVHDSAQLLAYDQPGLWIDIGTGGGFPGMIAAILREDPVLLVEPRKRRASFLAQAATELGLGHVEVAQSRIEQIGRRAAVISARAVMSISGLLEAAQASSGAHTRWLLPRGRNYRHDVADAQEQWHGVFHVEQSQTDPESAILIVEKVRPK